MVDVDHNCVPFSTCVPAIGGNVALLNVLPAGDGDGGRGAEGVPPSTQIPHPSHMTECFRQRVNNFHIIAAFQCYNLKRIGQI